MEGPLIMPPYPPWQWHVWFVVTHETQRSAVLLSILIAWPAGRAGASNAPPDSRCSPHPARQGRGPVVLIMHGLNLLVQFSIRHLTRADRPFAPSVVLAARDT
jgi:hypothetical protein